MCLASAAVHLPLQVFKVTGELWVLLCCFLLGLSLTFPMHEHRKKASHNEQDNGKSSENVEVRETSLGGWEALKDVNPLGEEDPVSPPLLSNVMQPGAGRCMRISIDAPGG